MTSVICSHVACTLVRGSTAYTRARLLLSMYKQKCVPSFTPPLGLDINRIKKSNYWHHDTLKLGLILQNLGMELIPIIFFKF